MKKIIECGWCIENDKFHGVNIYVGDRVDENEYCAEHGQSPVCCDCGNEYDLFNCVID